MSLALDPEQVQGDSLADKGKNKGVTYSFRIIGKPATNKWTRLASSATDWLALPKASRQKRLVDKAERHPIPPRLTQSP